VFGGRGEEAIGGTALPGGEWVLKAGFRAITSKGEFWMRRGVLGEREERVGGWGECRVGLGLAIRLILRSVMFIINIYITHIGHTAN
jgi:hypothetical protein